jgi:hypothetical protein
VVTQGKTPLLSGDEMRWLLSSIDIGRTHRPALLLFLDSDSQTHSSLQASTKRKRAAAFRTCRKIG